MNTYIDYLSWLCEQYAGVLFALYCIVGVIYTIKKETNNV